MRDERNGALSNIRPLDRSEGLECQAEAGTRKLTAKSRRMKDE